MNGILRGLRENQAKSDAQAVDPRLRGRTYAIPFEDVWQASIGLCGGGLRRWAISSSDDRAGVIEVIARAALLGPDVDIRVLISLDHNAQTRVDLWAAARTERGDLGRTRRLVGRFLKRLDRGLKATPAQILDPALLPVFEDQS